MSQPERAGAVVYVQDLDRLVAFYAALGLEVAERTADFAVLTSPVLELALVVTPADLADPLPVADPPVRREDTPIKLSFPVRSIADLRAAVPALGGALDPPEQEWLWHGRRVCDGHDPEGNGLQVREPRGD